jgi:hypothetical protein
MFVRINISKKGPRITQSIAACISLSKKRFEVQSFSLPIYENPETIVKKKKKIDHLDELVLYSVRLKVLLKVF